jgi:hypothetical protein
VENKLGMEILSSGGALDVVADCSVSVGTSKRRRIVVEEFRDLESGLDELADGIALADGLKLKSPLP